MIDWIKNLFSKPYKKIKLQEQQLAACGKEIHKLNLEIKKLKRTPITSIHPEYKRLIKEVREINGRMLYQFVNPGDMPHNRYTSCTSATTEFNMRMDTDSMVKYHDIGESLFTKILESESLPKTRKLAASGLTNLGLLKRQIEMLISVDASYRLASITFFWKDENLDDYDFEIGDEKIKLFKEIGFESFFLAKPMNNFLPPMDLSPEDLRVYSQYEKELKSLLSKQSKEQNAKSMKPI